MTPEHLAQKLASLQQWMGSEIAARQAALYPETPWAAPRSIADATVVVDPQNDKLYPSVNPNHVEHLGTSGLASRQILAEIVDLYRSAGADRFFVYLSPSGQTEEIEAWLVESGFGKMVELSVLWRQAQVVQRPVSGFEIRICLEMHANELRQVVAEENDDFGYSPATLDMLGTADFYTLLATEGFEPAATGSLYVHEQIGYLGNGKTLEPFRNRGAQSALIAARISLASVVGCTDAVSETYRFLETSYRNLIKAGFVDLYSRAIYKWEDGC